MVWMEKMLGEHTIPAPEIIPFPEIKYCEQGKNDD
jgi:phosphinothricin acetyltransferase